MFTQEETLAILKLLVEAHVNDAVYKPEYERVKAQVEAQEQHYRELAQRWAVDDPISHRRDASHTS